jgi:hypothetical protein
MEIRENDRKNTMNRGGKKIHALVDLGLTLGWIVFFLKGT